MELFKDYDYTIEYHLDRVNVMVDTFNKKVMGSLAYMQIIYNSLLAALRDIGDRQDMNYFGALLARFKVQPILIVRVREAQCHDSQLMKIRGEVNQRLNTDLLI